MVWCEVDVLHERFEGTKRSEHVVALAQLDDRCLAQLGLGQGRNAQSAKPEGTKDVADKKQTHKQRQEYCQWCLAKLFVFSRSTYHINQAS